MMTNYMTLAFKYIKSNSRRSIISVIGVTLTVLVLYSGLNLAWSFLLQARAEERETHDYELVLFTDDAETTNRILAEDKVKSAYIGPYYDYDMGRSNVLYNSALYINTTNPYRMNDTFTELTRKYGVDGDYNAVLADYYMQGEEGDIWMLVILFVLLIAYIFSIFGVGIVRNAIHLSMLENIRDYGNLRCIGSSKGQLKRLIFLQGMMLELAGIICGTILGSIVTSIIAAVIRSRGAAGTIETVVWGEGAAELHAGFHLLPLLVIVVEFLFDLYFIMDENVKLVTKMSPVSAIRGEYRVRMPKIKARNKNLFRFIFAKIFGLDGDYAFKNIMRNPGRFYRTVGAMVFGIAAFMGMASVTHVVVGQLKETLDMAGYYQIYVCNEYEKGETIDQVESSLPKTESLAALANMKDITEARRMYVAESYVAAQDEIPSHFTEAYKNSDLGSRMMTTLEKELAGENVKRHPDWFRAVSCYGYGEEDLNRYLPVLVDGTLDVSPEGVILVNRVLAYDENPNSISYNDEYDYYYVEYTDYKVGDTLKLVDIGELHRRMDEPLQALRMEAYEALYALSQDNTYNDEHTMEEFDKKYWTKETPQIARAEEIYDEFKEKEQALMEVYEKELMEEGYFKTFTIEGIVSEDVNIAEDSGMMFTSLRVVMPLETYFSFTGTDETQATGMMYHTNKIMPDINRILNYIGDRFDSPLDVEFQIDEWGSSGYNIFISYASTSADYLGKLFEVSYLWKGVIVAVAVTMFILLLSGLNMVNATASGLHLRRGELAQLRVIGVSKKHLMRMVMLEGIIIALFADVIGTGIGVGVTYWLFSFLKQIYRIRYYFPAGMMILAILVSILVSCGAIYFPLKRMSNDLASDLKIAED